jgi:hypothetical protein
VQAADEVEGAGRRGSDADKDEAGLMREGEVERFESVARFAGDRDAVP